MASSLGLQGPSAPIGAQLLASGVEDAPATVYHANLVAGSNSSVAAALQQPLNSAALVNMQASAEANSLDLQAMQSMDWLFKKERIYLLAQFWQQVRHSKTKFTCDYKSSPTPALSNYFNIFISFSFLIIFLTLFSSLAVNYIIRETVRFIG